MLQMPNTLTLFIFLLLNATHKDKKVGTSTGVIELRRGQYIGGTHQLAGLLKLSRSKIMTSLSHLKNLGIIDIKSTNKFSIYTIVNYGKYQDVENVNSQSIDIKSTTDQQQIDTKQECKNVRIKEKGPDKSGPVLLDTFLKTCKETGEPALRDTDTVMEFAADAGIPPEFLRLAWEEFKTRNRESAKRYKDWRLAFNNCVKANWYKLWYRSEDGQYLLTGTGQTIQAALQQRKLREEGGAE